MEERFRLFIADHPFFKDISQSERLIADVVRNSKIRRVDQHRILINQDEQMYHIYFVLSGQISIFVKKQKMEMDYERELRLHFEEVRKKYDQVSQNESENKVVMKKVEMKLKNAFKLIDRNEKQYDDPIYRNAFPNFENDYLTNTLNIFPLKRILTVNAGQVIGEVGVSPTSGRQMLDRLSNITAVSQTKVTVAQIPFDYINQIIPQKKYTVITTSLEQNFGNILAKDQHLIASFFEKQVFEKNKVIFRNKENTDKIYLIGKGEVELSTSINNQSQKLMHLFENDVFGHENFSSERSYKAMSLSNETFVYSIEKQLFFELIENKIIFSQISAIGDEKVKRCFQMLEEAQQQKEEQKRKEQQMIEQIKGYTENTEQSSDQQKQRQTLLSFLDSKRNLQLHMNKIQFQEGQINSTLNSSLLIEGTVNTSSIKEKQRSYTNHQGSDKKDSLKNNISKTNPDYRSPLRMRQEKSESKFKEASPSGEDAQQIEADEQNQLPNRILNSSEKFKKYKFGFGSSKKKDTLGLPSISSQEQNTTENKKRNKSPTTLVLTDNELFRNEKIKEASVALEDILILNQKTNMSVTSFESKDTQLALQKTLDVHKTIQNEISKPQINQPKINSPFLQDLSQQENFEEIQEKVKQSIFRKKQKSPSPHRGKNKDAIDFILQSRLRKLKSRHHSIENINSNSFILLNKKNHSTLMPLDVQFKLEREKYKRQQKQRTEGSRNSILQEQKTEISLNITDQMRAITPLLSGIQQEQDEFSSDFTLNNEVLKNIKKSIVNDKVDDTSKQLEKSILMQKYLSVNVQPQSVKVNEADLNRDDQQLGPYNMVKLNKKRKQLKYLTHNQQIQEIERQSSELKYIDYEGCQLSSKLKEKEMSAKENKLNKKSTAQKLTIDNEQITINPHNQIGPETNRSILIQQQQQQSQQEHQPQQNQQQTHNSQLLMINGESKQIREKMNTQPVSITPKKKPLQSIQLNQSTNVKGHTMQTLHMKKNSEPAAPMTKFNQHHYHNTIDTLILFEQNSTSQILNHQTTLPLMEKIHNPNSAITRQSKNRSLTIEENYKAHQKLNVTEILGNTNNNNNYSSHKRAHTQTSVSPMYKKQRDVSNTLPTEGSICEDSSAIEFAEHPVIHQAKKKFSKLPEILKHKAYIQKKLKRQFIRSPHVNERFEVEPFNKHLQMYQDSYNLETKYKNTQGSSGTDTKYTRNTQDNILNMTQFTENQIFSLSQPGYQEVNGKSRTYHTIPTKEATGQNRNKDQIEIQILNGQNQSQQNTKLINLQKAFNSSVTTTANNKFNKSTSKHEKNQLNKTMDVMSNDMLYSTLYVKKIMNDDSNQKLQKVEKLTQEKSQSKSQIRNDQTNDTKEQEDNLLNVQKQLDMASRATSKTSNRKEDSVNQQGAEGGDSINTHSQQVLEKNNSQCSFAFGSPIKYSSSQLALEQNKLLTLNRDPKVLIASFYNQSNSPVPNQQNPTDKKQFNSTQKIELQRAKKDSFYNNTTQIATNNLNNQNQTNDLQSVSLADNDLSHLSIIKQLEIQRKTDAVFQFQNKNE